MQFVGDWTHVYNRMQIQHHALGKTAWMTMLTAAGGNRNPEIPTLTTGTASHPRNRDFLQSGFPPGCQLPIFPRKLSHSPENMASGTFFSQNNQVFGLDKGARCGLVIIIIP